VALIDQPKVFRQDQLNKKKPNDKSTATISGTKIFCLLSLFCMNTKAALFDLSAGASTAMYEFPWMKKRK